MARVTSRDVAREAGVSQTTVSFVLNDRPDQTIPDQTRAAVLEAAKRLGYVPSAAGRSLKRGRSNVVLCVLPDVPVSEALEEFKKSLSSALGDADYACVFLHADRSETPLSSLWQHVHPAVVVAFGPLSASDAEPVRRAGIALLDGVLEPSNAAMTGLDQREVGYLQVRHLVEKGHRRIGFGAVDDPREVQFCEPRLRGVEQACLEHGVSKPVVRRLDYSKVSALSALDHWTSGPDEVTAVAAFNDLAAMSILAAARDSKVSVPTQLAVIGVDDLPSSALAAPSLTTVAMDLGVPAAILAGRILEAAGASSSVDRHIDTTAIFSIVQREST